MRTRILALLLAICALVPVGCATGFRVGGDRYGAGVGGYVGPVPHQQSFLPPEP